MAVRELDALERVLGGSTPTADEAVALLDTPEARLPELLGAAAAARDRGRGRRLTFSAKVFVPLSATRASPALSP